MSVSVIIPTYSRIRGLAELFETILAQTIKPIEIIVVDDPTPDHEIERLCEEEIHRFKRSGIELIYIRNPRERSTAIARNVGAEKAKGEILLFLDSDVLLHMNYVAEILRVFKRYGHALGVQGWHANITRNEFRYQLKRIFKLEVYSVNSCKYGEYPRVLTKTINCENLRGSNMAIKQKVFGEGFHFDEALKGYAFMEDLLFSHSIFQKYPGTLYITPYAKCKHELSSEGRTQNSQQQDVCRKYVLKSLFGLKGLVFYWRQRLGVFTYEMFKRLRAPKKKYKSPKKECLSGEDGEVIN